MYSSMGTRSVVVRSGQPGQVLSLASFLALLLLCHLNFGSSVHRCPVTAQQKLCTAFLGMFCVVLFVRQSHQITWSSHLSLQYFQIKVSFLYLRPLAKNIWIFFSH